MRVKITRHTVRNTENPCRLIDSAHFSHRKANRPVNVFYSFDDDDDDNDLNTRIFDLIQFVQDDNGMHFITSR